LGKEVFQAQGGVLCCLVEEKLVESLVRLKLLAEEKLDPSLVRLKFLLEERMAGSW
jgi:G3E family GTPase